MHCACTRRFESVLSACARACSCAYRDYIIVHNKYASHPTWCAAASAASAAAAAQNMRLHRAGQPHGTHAPIRPTNTNNQHMGCIAADAAAVVEDARGPNMCPHTIFMCASACARARVCVCACRRDARCTTDQLIILCLSHAHIRVRACVPRRHDPCCALIACFTAKHAIFRSSTHGPYVRCVLLTRKHPASAIR